MNQITTVQNSERQLARLAAQRELYSSAKKFYLIESIGSIIIPLILTFISTFFTNISIYSALYGIGFYLLDSLVIELLITERKTKAAKIQELFDCDVLEMEKSPFKAVADVTVEDVLAYYDAHKKIETNIEKIKDWYPKEVEELDIRVARLICQKMNYAWDSRLRKTYSNFLKSVVVILVIIIIVGITLGRLPGEQVPLILAGILPLFRFCIKLFEDNRNATEKLIKLNGYFDGLWARIIENSIDEKELDESARHIQNEIYDFRIKNPLIPDAFYKFFKDKDESLMARSAENLITQLKEKNGRNKLKS